MDRILPFTEEHQMVRDSIKKWLQAEVIPCHEQWEKDGIVPREIWNKAGEQGFLCPWVPEQYGGMGADFLTSVAITEEVANARATGLSFSLHNDVVTPYIYHFGTEEQKKKYLPKCVSGECVTAVAMTEPNTGSDLQGIRTTAIKDGDRYVINGQKTFISNGQHCDLVVVVAKTDPNANPAYKGISLILVDADTPGFSRGRNLEKVGLHAQDTSELNFDDCRVPTSSLLGTVEGQGFLQLMQALQQERLVVALGAQAGAEVALRETLKYTKEREAFGRPISKFQNTQFKLAEMATKVEIGRTFVDRLIQAHIEGKNVVKEVSMAKWWITDMLQEVVDDGVQLHGGYGYMLEYPIAKMYQDARVQRIFAGTNEIMKIIIAKQMGL